MWEVLPSVGNNNPKFRFRGELYYLRVLSKYVLGSDGQKDFSLHEWQKQYRRGFFALLWVLASTGSSCDLELTHDLDIWI